VGGVIAVPMTNSTGGDAVVLFAPTGVANSYGVAAGGVPLTSASLDGQGRLFFGLGALGAAKGGVIRWDPNLSNPQQKILDSAVTTPPLVAADGAAYINTADGHLAVHVLGLSLVAPRWDISGVGTAERLAMGSDGTAYVAAKGGPLSAVSPDGVVKWSFPAGGGTLGHAAVGGDGAIFVTAGDKLIAVNPDGTERWSVSSASTFLGPIAIDALGRLLAPDAAKLGVYAP
jgi:outer membrane protein assembly factor BamB